MKDKRTHFIAVLAVIFSFTCCNSLDEVDNINKFDIDIVNCTEMDDATGAYVFNLGDDIQFRFSGQKVDNIIFYSGDIGEEFRYRNRTYGTVNDNIVPTVSMQIGLTNPVRPIEGIAKFQFGIAFDKDIPSEWDDVSVATTPWRFYTLFGGVRTYAATTQFFNLKDSVVSSPSAAGLYDWFSHEDVSYCFRAKSNIAHQNLFILRAFNVYNTETRDYSYIYEGETHSVKKTLVHTILKDYSVLGADHAVNSSATINTAACWGMYTPKETIKEGMTNEVHNSQHYAFNAAELGAKIGEYSGKMPWNVNNKFGQEVRGAYPVQVLEPIQNIMDENGRIITDEDGSPLTEPTEEMKNEPYESWIVCRAHNIHQLTPDKPTTYVKSKVESMSYDFSYSYQNHGRGLYTMTFYANNQNSDETKYFVKEFKVIIK